MTLSNNEGKILLSMARTAIRIRLNSANDSAFSNDYSKYEEKFDNLIDIVLKKNKINRRDIPAFLLKNKGVFVTINKGIKLRGCIGLPETTKPLYDGVVEAAVGAAFGDPRFSRLREDEFDKVSIEVSILNTPEPASNTIPEEFLDNFNLGEDGIIIKGDYGSALLLPQVAIEHAMSKIEFMEAISIKAGLKRTAWKDEETKLYKFQVQIFKEAEMDMS